MKIFVINNLLNQYFDYICYTFQKYDNEKECKKIMIWKYFLRLLQGQIVLFSQTALRNSKKVFEANAEWYITSFQELIR